VPTFVAGPFADKRIKAGCLGSHQVAGDRAKPANDSNASCNECIDHPPDRSCAEGMSQDQFSAYGGDPPCDQRCIESCQRLSFTNSPVTLKFSSRNLFVYVGNNLLFFYHLISPQNIRLLTPFCIRPFRARRSRRVASGRCLFSSSIHL